MITIDTLKIDQSPDANISHSQFDEIVAYIEQENIDKASSLIEKHLHKGILDIRLIVYYFYAHFFYNGIKSFAEALPYLTILLSDRWSDLKPINRKDKQVQNSLTWYVSNLVSKLKYCEKLSKTGKIDPIWEMSTSAMTQSEIQKILETMSAFQQFYNEKWPKSSMEDRYLHLMQIVKNLKIYAKEELPEIVEEAPQVSEPIIEEVQMLVEEVKVEEPVIVEELQIVEIAEELHLEQLAPQQTPEAVPSSAKFEQLLEKLRVFELLTQKKDFVKASLVAKDIDHLIENFDPLDYFPQLFSNYFSLISKEVSSLEEHWESKNSLKLKYLKKLYKTDINLFIEC